MQTLIHTSCSVPILSALNMQTSTANFYSCNYVSYCIVSSHMQSYHVLRIETMSLIQGLFTGSNVVLHSILSDTDYNICGNEKFEHCVAGVCTCFCTQATVHVAVRLTYVIGKKQTCINYVSVLYLFFHITH